MMHGRHCKDTLQQACLLLEKTQNSIKTSGGGDTAYGWHAIALELPYLAAMLAGICDQIAHRLATAADTMPDLTDTQREAIRDAARQVSHARTPALRLGRATTTAAQGIQEMGNTLARTGSEPQIRI